MYDILKNAICVMDEKISARARERIAKGLCAVCVVICLAVSLFTQNTGLYKEETEVITFENNYNLLSAGHNTAMIQLTKSEISKTEDVNGARPFGGNVVKNNDISEKGTNTATENPKAPVLVQGVNADNGLQPETFEQEIRYQYPVEPGYPADQNYGGGQDGGDFILRDTFATVSEERLGFVELYSASEEEPGQEEEPEREEEAADIPRLVLDEGPADGLENEWKREFVISGNQIEEPEESLPEEDEPEENPQEPASDRTDLIYDTDADIDTDTDTDTDIDIDIDIDIDTNAPVLGVDENLFHLLQAEGADIYCTNDFRLSVSCNDLENGGGIERLSYVYGDKAKIMFDHLDDPVLSLTDDFYGKIVMNCTDMAGNPSETAEEYFLVEDDAPTVSTSEGELCTVPYTLWVDISDDGNIVSGIESVECTVNGEEFAIEDPVVCEVTELYQDLTVASRYKFPIVLQEIGTYHICITAADNAGNVTEYETQVEVQEPELVSILMPDSFVIHIDPQRLLEREQIFSDELILENMSDFDVRVNINSVDLKVKDGVSDQGMKKDCTVYLTAPDTGEKIPLQKGVNEGVYSYRLPKGAQGDINQIFFCGDVTDGSDEMWEDSDISINVGLSFEKWEE